MDTPRPGREGDESTPKLDYPASKLAKPTSSLFYLVTDKGTSKKMVNALSIRVGLSVLLFVLLMLAWSQGLDHAQGHVTRVLRRVQLKRRPWKSRSAASALLG